MSSRTHSTDGQAATDGMPAAGPLAVLETGLAAHRRLLLIGLVLLAATLRFVAFQQLVPSPIGWLHEWTDSDMHFFDAWAKVIAGGDLLTDRALHPYHGWHADIAALHLHAHPEEEAALARLAAASGDVRPPGHLLWDRWFGGKRFHQEPLYAYLVALTYVLAGPTVLAVFTWQLALGVGSVLLVWWLARRLGGELAGLLGGVLACAYGPLLLAELTLLRTSSLVFATLGLTALLSSSASSRSPLRWWLVGFCCGLGVLLQTTLAAFLAAALLCPLLAQRRRPLRALRLGLSVGCGVALALLPAVARNVAVGAPMLSLTSVLPLNAVLAWSPRAHVRIDGFAPNLLDFAEIMGHTDGRDLPVLVETLLAPDPLGARTRAFVQRLANAFHAFEAPDNVNLYYARLHAPVLSLAGLGFGAVAPLALLGLALVVTRWRARPRDLAGPTWPLLLAVLASLLPLVVFGTLARYRLLLAAALLPFAAMAPVACAEFLLARRWARAGCLLTAALAGVLLVSRPLPSDVSPIRAVDYVVPFQVFYGPLASQALQQGRPDIASDLLAQGLGLIPPEVAELTPEQPATNGALAGLAQAFAGYHRALADCSERAGRSAEAAAARARADELARVAALP